MNCAYRQFINWHNVVDPEKPKPRKVPFDPVTGHPIDPHNPANWKTFDEAVATGHPVGFVLTALDPFFFFDLDDCFDGTGWKPEAVSLFNMFPGAAREVSISGTGLHVMGRCDKIRLADRRNKWGGWLEFYTTGRFIALGHGFEGDFNLDWTDTLLQIVPERPAVDATALTAGPVPEYTGPTDDADLIRRMCAARGSIGAQFGTKASAKDLWEGDASMLCQVFPSPSGDVYDRSSADAALMSHLAFWTGKDAARMDRLFRLSKLMRPKYEARQDYRTATITNAIGQCRSVYNVVKSNAQPETELDLPGGFASGGEVLTVGEQIEHFKGCVYIRDMHRMLVPGGAILKNEQFRATYGGHVFLMSPDGSGPTKNAFEAFTENRAYKFPKAETSCFQPKREPGSIVDGAVNVYYPVEVRRVKGDVSPFLKLVTKLLPNERDRAILLAWCAAVVQNPGSKFQWAIVLQGAPGNGKTAVAKCLEYAVGSKYTHCPAAEDLGNQFNSYIENKLLISVEEVHLQGKRELLDTLKPLITNDRIEVQAKGIDKRMIDNFTNWFMCTNHQDAVLKTKDDRRYAIFFSAQQSIEEIRRDGMDGNYFPDLWKWFRADGFAIVADYLMTYPIPAELDPTGTCQRAPDTSSTAAAITASMGRIEQEILEAIDQGEKGFRNGWISTAALDALFTNNRFSLSRQKTAEMLRDLGFKQVGRANKLIMEESDKRPVLYIHRAHWREGLTVEDYAVAQGYASMTPRLSVVPLPGQPTEISLTRSR